MRLIYGALSALVLTVCTAAFGASASADGAPSSRDLAPEQLRIWADARAGTGEPVYWIGEGEVYAYPSGEQLFGIIGFDASTVIWPDEPSGTVLHLTRKVFTYTDLETGEILTEYNGQAVEPVAFPYQLFTYRFENGKIYSTAEYGTAPEIHKTKSKNGMRVRSMGADTLLVNAAVFLNLPLASGKKLRAWESYDFFLHAGGARRRTPSTELGEL